MTLEDFYSFFNAYPKEDFDIRITHDARYVDQKCTPDIVSFIADCIQSSSCANKTFTINDLWDEEYFYENSRVIFGKPSPKDKNARNEYNKVLSQPLKLLAYAHVLNVNKNGREMSFEVNRKDILDFISLNERKAYNFMYCFFMKVIECSGLTRIFEEYKNNYALDCKAARATIYDKYYRFISANTPSQSRTDINRIFHKVFNIYTFHEMLPGSKGGIVLFNDLMYNKINARDKKSKEKYQTRVQAKGKESAFYIAYLVNKAINRVHKLQGNKSEVHDELAIGTATEVHHIFPKSEFPQLANYLENLILLTSNQHRQKAHPNSHFNIIDKEYQLVCLMAKSRTIEDYINEHGETFYTKKAFIEVINTGTYSNALTENASFTEIRRYLHQTYNSYDWQWGSLNTNMVTEHY